MPKENFKIKFTFKYFNNASKKALCPHQHSLIFNNFRTLNDEDADAYYYNDPSPHQDIINNYPDKGKPTIFLTQREPDRWPTNPISPNTFVIRTGIEHYKLQKHEYIYPHCEPYFIPLDPIYTDKPTVSFMGNSATHPIRNKYFSFFNSQKDINSNLIHRTKKDGVLTGDYNPDPIYMQNIENSIFCLAPRGAGNWSGRFWEALSFGRIPVHLNTEQEVSFKDLIDWDKMRVTGSSFEELKEKMLTIHANKELCFEMQSYIVKIVKKYLEPKPFFRLILKKILQGD